MSNDRSWMYNRRHDNGLLHKKYVEGVYSFLGFAFSNRGNNSDGMVRCPCSKCQNARYFKRDEVGVHLMSRGFVENYYVWTYHGEVDNASRLSNYVFGETSNIEVENIVGESSSIPNITEENVDSFRDMVFDAFPPQFGEEYDESIQDEPNNEAREFYAAINEANQPLYEGSDQSVLQWCSEFLNIKMQHSISAAGCDNMLKLNRKMARPEDRERIPDSYVSLKRMMRKLGLGHVTFDICENNCFLYYGDGAEYRCCPVCGEGRYKENQSNTNRAKKKLWYFPITPRLQRLYMSKKTAEFMIWHKKYGGGTEKIIHPAGGEAWKHIDRIYPSFAADARNVRLGLCTDGFSPFSHSATPYSCWPVFVTPYNMPPDLCMRQESIFLSLIIFGPKSPEMSIDVMLRPLIDELNILWTDGALTYDSFRKQNFTMRAVLMWTISDFPAYGMLSGWSTHGRLSCPYCMERTKSFRLTNGYKHCWFDCHRQFLHDIGHPFRKNKTDFYKGRAEMDQCPERRSGLEMFELVQLLPDVQFGKGLKKIPGLGSSHNWKKKSIFWELPYWPTLLIRHNLDVMHCQKNFFDNIFYTVIDDSDRTKDGIKSRMDLQEHTRKKDLFLTDLGGGRFVKRKAKYTVDREQKIAICEWLKGLRFPDGYASNLSRCVNLQTLKITGMKSHDCHVFMQRLLPIAFRDFLPDNIWGALTDISSFFRSLCATEIQSSIMEQLQETIVETMCKLEKRFPPAFFDCMEHLAVHLPYEAKVGGPVFFRWMFPFERRMYVLKSNVKNKARVEGSICEAYLNEEISNFCSHYFGRDVDTRLTRLRRNEVSWTPQFEGQLPLFTHKGKPIGNDQSTRTLSVQEYNAAMVYILMNCEQVEPWIRLFDARFGGNITDLQLELKRINEFVPWFKQTVLSGEYEGFDERIYALAYGANMAVAKYKGYIVNGFKFHTEEYGQALKTMNSGICIKATSGGSGEMDFYGMLKEVIELTFSGTFPVQSIFMFKCDWYDVHKGLSRHPKYTHLVDIDPRSRLSTSEPFMLATQASQVFYAPYPSFRRRAGRKGLWAVCNIRARHIINISPIEEIINDIDREQDYYQEDNPPLPSNHTDPTEYTMPTELADEATEIVELGNDTEDYERVEDFNEAHDYIESD